MEYMKQIGMHGKSGAITLISSTAIHQEQSKVKNSPLDQQSTRHTLILRIFSCGENMSNLFLAGALGAEPAPSGGGGGMGPVERGLRAAHSVALRGVVPLGPPGGGGGGAGPLPVRRVGQRGFSFHVILEPRLLVSALRLTIKHRSQCRGYLIL